MEIRPIDRSNVFFSDFHLRSSKDDEANRAFRLFDEANSKYLQYQYCKAQFIRHYNSAKGNNYLMSDEYEFVPKLTSYLEGMILFARSASDFAIHGLLIFYNEKSIDSMSVFFRKMNTLNIEMKSKDFWHEMRQTILQDEFSWERALFGYNRKAYPSLRDIIVHRKNIRVKEYFDVDGNISEFWLELEQKSGGYDAVKEVGKFISEFESGFLKMMTKIRDEAYEFI